MWSLLSKSPVPCLPRFGSCVMTGISSDFGAEFVKAALARGDKVITTARNEKLIADLERFGAATMQLDVTGLQEVNR